MIQYDPKKIEKDVIKILKSEFWLPSIKTKKTYCRLNDNNGGTGQGRLCIMFSGGDAAVSIDNCPYGVDFRNSGGGGRSLYTRKAIMILALAMQLDQKENPD